LLKLPAVNLGNLQGGGLVARIHPSHLGPAVSGERHSKE
jgi:hypothetical protein